MLQKERIDQIRRRIEAAREFIQSAPVRAASSADQAIDKRVSELNSTCSEVEQCLKEEPKVDVALVGRSRGGKSTLINSLVGEEILETSAVRPCSAAIVKLLYADAWSVEITFVTKEALLTDWQNAVKDAEACLDSQDELSKDESKYFKDTLERFIELFGIDKNLPNREKLDQVRSAELPKELAGLLGKTPPVENVSIEKLKKVVSNYLSTEKNYWTIVDRCVIRGRFHNWHRGLGVVDLPGTNDTNAHRSLITDRVRNQTNAVGIVTQESNLGDDIESWLRESRVLADFIESVDSGRHHLFIIRTQLDNYVPQIDEDDEEREEELCQAAIETYKRDQTSAFYEMLRDIVQPVIDAGRNGDSVGTGAIDNKRRELLARVTNVPVHFVSALAHEVFEGRAKIGKRTKKVMMANFGEDVLRTGVPGLKDFMNQIAENYLEKNFYEDLDRQIESEFEQLTNFFCSQIKSLEAAKKGAGASVLALTDQVKHEIVPWVSDEVAMTVRDFDRKGKEGEEAIRHRLHQSWQLAHRRFQDKIDKWNQVAWSSLKAMSRKGGRHLTNRGQYLDVANDICSILVDDLLMVWTSYRDDIIQKQVSRATQDFSAELVEKLGFAKSQINNPDAKEAIDVIVAEITAVADLQREELLRKVDLRIKKLESIGKPAYKYIQKSFGDVFVRIVEESGTGCQQRMRDHLIKGINDKLPDIREHINDLINQTVGGLLEHCSAALKEFGDLSTDKINDTVVGIELSQKDKDLKKIEKKKDVIEGVFKILPPPKKAS